MALCSCPALLEPAQPAATFPAVPKNPWALLCCFSAQMCPDSSHAVTGVTPLLLPTSSKIFNTRLIQQGSSSCRKHRNFLNSFL